MVSIQNTKRAEKITPGSHRNIGNFIERANIFQKMEPSLEKDSIHRTYTGTRQEGHQERPDELISIDSNDLHGRPQGAQGADLPLDTFPAFRPYTPRMKYLPGGPPPPSNHYCNYSRGTAISYQYKFQSPFFSNSKIKKLIL